MAVQISASDTTPVSELVQYGVDLVTTILLFLPLCIGVVQVIITIHGRCANKHVVLILTLIGMNVETMLIFAKTGIACQYQPAMRRSVQIIPSYLDIYFRSRGFEASATSFSTITNHNVTNNISSDCCLDLRILAVISAGLIFTVLTMCAINQNIAKRKQYILYGCVILYYISVMCIISWLQTTHASQKDDVFDLSRNTTIRLLPICEEDPRVMFISVLVESLCLFGPSLIVLLMIVRKGNVLKSN